MDPYPNSIFCNPGNWGKYRIMPVTGIRFGDG